MSLKNKILSISYRLKIPHVGSNITAIEILEEMFNVKNSEDIIIVSAGHYALAYYVMLEKYYGIDAEALYENDGGHPHLDEKNYIFSSSGSLGLGLCVAVGRAFYNRNRDVYVLISDGECAEGCVWEALKFIYENKMTNIHVYVNVNGWAAYDKVDTVYLVDRLKTFLPTIHVRYTNVNQYPFLKDLNAHYHRIKKEDLQFFDYIEKNS